MNLQPMMPGRPGWSQALIVYCVKCSARVSSEKVLCDLNGKPGDYYCPDCAAKVRAELLAEDDAYSQKVADHEQAQAERDTGGTEPGDTCGRDGCDGTIRENETENCSCHISPPCHRCVTAGVSCDTCGYDTRGES